MDLDAILTQGGGLNKEAKTPQTYLKLLSKAVCTQSNRHLSIVLEAILKTNSKSTLTKAFMHKSAAEVTGLHILIALLCKIQSNKLMTAIVRKGLRVLQHLQKHGVVEGKYLVVCTRHFCTHTISKLLFDLTKHEDDPVRMLALTFQKLRYEIPREHHATHVTICEKAKQSAQRKMQQELEGLEEGEIPVEEK